MAGRKIMKTPFGTPAVVSTDDLTGRGAETMGRSITVPDDPYSSIPHELMHVGASDALNAATLGNGGVIEALVKALSQHAYGNDAIYQDPGEHIAYGYQEAATGKPDTAFQQSSSPEAVAGYPSGKTNMIVRNLLDVLGGGAEKFGRFMGRQ